MFGTKWWGGGSSSKAKKDNAKEAILAMRTQITTLEKRESHLERSRDEQEALARKLVATDKAGARKALVKKKQYESQLETTRGQMVSLEQQLSAIEAANLNYETMKIMSQGAQAMKSIHKGMDMDKLDSTMDDVRDQVALGEEISEAISRPLHEQDDAELEEEMEQLEQEALDDRMVAAGRAPAAPLSSEQQPVHEEPEEEDEDEEEVLRKLKAEMAM